MQKSPDSTPLVSVIIPTYNYGHFVADAVNSALRQTYPNMEIIVVDDGSTDNTQDVLKQFEGRIINIKKPNGGLSAARNTGLERAKGAYIAILDSDDVWLAEKTEKQIRAFAQNPELGVVSCSAYEVDYGLNVKKELPYKNYPDKAEFVKNLALRNIVSGGSSAMIKKECFDKVGGFDVEISPSADWEMWLRISQYYRFHLIEEPLVKIRAGSENMSSLKNAGKMLETELRVMEKLAANNIHFKGNTALQKEALSYRYFCAAWACWSGNEITLARRHILKALAVHPASFLNKNQAALLLKILIKSILRAGIPVNSVTKPFFKALYGLHVFVREGLIVLVKFFYAEPLFRSQCESVGPGLWMEQLPYIVGRGKIVIGSFVRISGKPGIGFSSKVHKEPELLIGDHTFIGHDTRFAVAERVRIGRHCYIAGGTVIADNDGHPVDAAERRANKPPRAEDVRPVEIGDDVWVGREAVILKGVKIGDRAIIGSRAVVTADVPADTIVAGNPAREIKRLKN